MCNLILVLLALVALAFYVFIAVASYKRRKALGPARFKGPVVISDNMFIIVVAFWPISLILDRLFRWFTRFYRSTFK